MTTMEKHGAEQHGGIPRGVLLGAFALVCFSIIATAAARVSDVGTVHMPQRRAVDTLDCARRGEGAITYDFAIRGWGSHVDPPSQAELNAGGYLKEIVWTPPLNLRPKPPAAPAKAGGS